MHKSLHKTYKTIKQNLDALQTEQEETEQKLFRPYYQDFSRYIYPTLTYQIYNWICIRTNREKPMVARLRN